MGFKAMGTVLLVGALAVVGVGCGGSSVAHVRRAGLGGEVRVRGLGMAEAYVLMEEHCRGRFEIIDEAEGMAMAMRDAAEGKPSVAETTIEGESVHYVCTSRRAASAR